MRRACNIRRNRRRRRLLVATAVFTAVVAAILLAWPLDPAPYLQVAASAELLDRDGRLLYPYLTDDEQWRFVRPIEEVSPYLIQATLATEDQRFHNHVGVDPIAMARAAMARLVGGPRSGASTITMQLVKRVHADRPRNVLTKLHEAWTAIRLDARVSKDALLETYLNVAPYGMNLVGCEAAARRYFGKPARELTLPEAALIAGLPKAPTAYMPLSHPERAQVRRDHVLHRMRQEGYVDDRAYEAAVRGPLNARRHEFPALAPHLAMTVRETLEDGDRRHTTLDAAVQRRVERQTAEAVRMYDRITNAAVMVVDVADATVIARVGSADFFDTPGGGQVDSCRAPRSPGSALKPLTFALAMERHKLYGGEKLHDGSLDYGLYHPENYDGLYRGVVTAAYALQHSLNVPAVATLDRVGAPAVHAFLQDCGLTTLIRAPEHYGLGLTLGNCEVRLDELTAAYTMLADLGRYRPLRTLRDESLPPPRRLLSRGVALKLFEMMLQPLPDEYGREVVRAAGVRDKVCWKTGTSTGHHDAWAFVYNQRYVVGVWMGNNDGSPSRWLIGAQAALPLAARIFRTLPDKTAPALPQGEGDLVPVRVCAASGLPASAWCPHVVVETFPREQYLHRTCDVHHPAPDGEGVAERWPGSARAWDLAAVTAPGTAARDASASTPRRLEALAILEPADQARFVLTEARQADVIRLRSSRDAREPVHWYLDGRYLASSTPQRAVQMPLSLGEHTLACMVDSGATRSVRFTVTPPETLVSRR